MAILFQSRPNSHDFEEESTAEHTGVLQEAIQEGKEHTGVLQAAIQEGKITIKAQSSLLNIKTLQEVKIQLKHKAL